MVITRSVFSAAILGLLVAAGGCAGSAAPAQSSAQAAPPPGSGGAPPARQDLTVTGRILDSRERTGAELGMKPGDMVIYLYRFRVERSPMSGLRAGEVIELRSKLAPPDNWRHLPLTVRLASYAGGADYWLVGFEEEAASGGATGD